MCPAGHCAPDSGGCAGAVRGLNSDEAYGVAGDSSPVNSNPSL